MSKSMQSHSPFWLAELAWNKGDVLLEGKEGHSSAHWIYFPRLGTMSDSERRQRRTGRTLTTTDLRRLHSHQAGSKPARQPQAEGCTLKWLQDRTPPCSLVLLTPPIISELLHEGSLGTARGCHSLMTKRQELSWKFYPDYPTESLQQACRVYISLLFQVREVQCRGQRTCLRLQNQLVAYTGPKSLPLGSELFLF